MSAEPLPHSISGYPNSTANKGSVEKDDFSQVPTITTPSGKKKVTFADAIDDSQVQTNQKTSSSKLGPVIATIVGLLFLGGAGLAGTWLFASNVLPHWVAQAVGTIGYSGNWGLLVGGGALGIGITGAGLYLLCVKENNPPEKTKQPIIQPTANPVETSTPQPSQPVDSEANQLPKEKDEMYLSLLSNGQYMCIPTGNCFTVYMKHSSGKTEVIERVGKSSLTSIKLDYPNYTAMPPLMA